MIGSVHEHLLTSSARHGSEIPSVFGLVDNIRGASAVSEQISLSKYMNNAWAEFARDPEKGLSKLGLPQWDPQSKL
jgi:carboxylesterase type B